MDEIEQLKAAAQEMMEALASIGEIPPPEVLQAVTQALSHVQQRILSIQQQGPNVVGPQPEIPEGADLLWILSGGQPEVFTQYLQTFPNQALNDLINNPGKLNQVITSLQTQMPQGVPDEERDGVPKAPLQSSNIYGFQYDPRSGELRVRFNEGAVYKYDGVPPAVFQILQAGAIPAKTSGKNQYGQWWKGKNPSLGASMHALIKLGGFPYQKIKG